MSRPRKPTAVLSLNGAYDKNPKRKKERENEPQIDEPLGDPPECLNESERARWHEIDGMYPWLNFSHRLIVEQAARLWALERSGKAKTGDSKLLQTAIRILGGTPSDSSKVKMPPKKADKNPYAELA